MKVLVTGANGQLGNSIKKIAGEFSNIDFIFTDIEELDITKQHEVIKYFINTKPDYCINTAAYTQVDKAESESELCHLINDNGAENIAIASKFTSTKLIHISSDYVYNNDNDKEMTEKSPTTPKGVYAESKLAGEKKIIKHLQKYIIIRTSWLYSEYGINFVNTIIKLSKEKKELKVVNDQVGSPTYATDLARFILNIIKKNKHVYGIFNFSNLGFTSWDKFAQEIVAMTNSNCKIIPIPSSEYPTLAPRPLNSKMAKDKITKYFDFDIPKWENSLNTCLNIIKKVSF